MKDLKPNIFTAMKLYRRGILSSKISNGALDEKNIERIENLFSIIKEREGLINAYYAALQKEAVFNPKLKSVLEQAHYLP